MNEYTGIADYYDLFMNSGYYKYEEIATAIAAMVVPNQSIRKIGFIVETTLKNRSSVQFDGHGSYCCNVRNCQRAVGRSR